MRSYWHFRRSSSTTTHYAPPLAGPVGRDSCNSAWLAFRSRRQVDTSGSVSIYNKTYYVGGCYTGTTVYVSVDPLRREWLFRDTQGNHVRTQPAEQLCQ